MTEKREGAFRTAHATSLKPGARLVVQDTRSGWEWRAGSEGYRGRARTKQDGGLHWADGQQVPRRLPDTSHSSCPKVTSAPRMLVPPPGSILFPGRRPGARVFSSPTASQPHVSSFVPVGCLSHTLFPCPGPGSIPALTNVPSLRSLSRDFCPSHHCVFPQSTHHDWTDSVIQSLSARCLPHGSVSPLRTEPGVVAVTAVSPVLSVQYQARHRDDAQDTC